MSVSHELRTPLTAIRGHVDALREGVAEDPEARAASLDVIAREGVRLERARRRRARPGEAGSAPLHAPHGGGRTWSASATRRTSPSVRRRAAAGSTTASASRRSPTIVSDGDRVLQIISNLLSNASAGRRTAGGWSSSCSARTAVCRSQSTTTARASRSEERERIFRPFWSRDDSAPGLGLAIAHELAAALGGSIQLESKPSAGQPLPAASCRWGTNLRPSGVCPSPHRSSICRAAARRLRAALVSLRPRRWTKNLLLFAGIIFAAKLGDLTRWGEALAAFAAYCARVERELPRRTTFATRRTTACIRSSAAADRPRRALTTARGAASQRCCSSRPSCSSRRSGLRLDPAACAPSSRCRRRTRCAQARRAAGRDGDRRALRHPRGCQVRRRST